MGMQSRRTGIYTLTLRGLLSFAAAWVAATAIYLDLPLVTHNARHYAGVPGLEVITEPDPAR